MAAKRNNQFVANLKQGFVDIQTVSQEGNFKLFAKQVVVIIVAFFALRYAYGKLNVQIKKDQEQINAIEVQKKSEKDYLANKDKLLTLEPRFPDIDIKNQWLQGTILDIFKEIRMTPQLEGTQGEDSSNTTYVAAGQNVSMSMGFMPLAHFIEKIENSPDYLRISEVSVAKNTDPNAIGDNKVTLRFNTIFPKEKIGSTLFSDYSELVQEKRSKQEQGSKRGKK